MFLPIIGVSLGSSLHGGGGVEGALTLRFGLLTPRESAEAQH